MKTLSTLASVAALALLTACRTTVNTVEPAQPAGERQMIQDKRILTDRSLSRSVSIVGVNQGPTAGGLLQVQVEVLNTTRSVKRFNYRFEWFDEAGMQFTSGTAYLPKLIEGKESVMLKSVAPNPRCRDFRLKLIEGN
jgi:uncharacterized protein YcfL